MPDYIEDTTTERFERRLRYARRIIRTIIRVLLYPVLIITDVAYKKLIKNRDNRPYLDEIYYQIAVLQEKKDSVNLAVLNYNKSLRAKQGGAKQKTFSYEKLANIYFKNLDYVTASAYYDSILKVAENKQNLRIKRIERRSRNLTTLTKNEKLLQRNDSILLLASMPKEALEEYFQEYINKIKKEDEALAKKK